VLYVYGAVPPVGVAHVTVADVVPDDTAAAAGTAQDSAGAGETAR
jgi:hypothetical protein